MDNAAFPLEVFQHIIDNLSDHGTGDMEKASDIKTTHRTLQSCSLVCKDFSDLCRPIIFREIEIGIHRGVSVSRSQLLEVLETNPNISSYVKSVKYAFNPCTEENLVLRDGKAVEDHSSIHNDQHGAALHTFFPKIESLSIRLMRPVTDNQDQDDIESLPGLILQSYAHHTSLACLSLDGLSQFYGLTVSVGDVLNLPFIRSIDVKCCAWVATDIRSPSPNRPQMNTFPLQHASFTGWVAFATPFPFTFFEYCPRLTSFDCGLLSYQDDLSPYTAKWNKVNVYQEFRTMTLEDFSRFSRICNTASENGEVAFPTLNHLELKFSEYYGELEDAYKILEHAPNLQTLWLHRIQEIPGSPVLQIDRCLTHCMQALRELSVRYGDNTARERQDYSFAVPRIHDAISSVRGNNRLETLKLSVMVEEEHPDAWMDAMLQIWSRFDEVLGGNRCSDFPKLKKVEIEVCSYITAIEGQRHSSGAMRQLTDNEGAANGVLQDVKDYWARTMPLLHASYTPNFRRASPLTRDYILILTRHPTDK